MTDRISRFSALPATPIAWGGVTLAALYACDAHLISRMSHSSGLSMLLQWVFGVGVGAAALAFITTAFRRKERWWLLIVGAIVVAFWWLQWMILLIVGLLTGGLWG